MPDIDNEQQDHLNVILTTYDRWAAAVTSGGDPRGGDEVIEVVMRYAAQCRADGGPDLTNRRGPAFVMAMLSAADDYHSTGADPADLENRTRILQATGDWFVHVNEEWGSELADGLVTAAESGDHDVHDEVEYRDDGSYVRRTTVTFRRDDDEQRQPRPASDALTPGDYLPTGAAGLLAGVTGQWWKVVRRRYGHPQWLDEGTSFLRGSKAYAAAHQARRSLAPDEVVDIYQGHLFAWRLADTLPELLDSQIASESGEWVLGTLDPSQLLDEATPENPVILSVDAIGVVEPAGAGWRIYVRTAPDEDTFTQPRRMRDALHRTRAAAIDAIHEQWAQRIAGTDETGSR